MTDEQAVIAAACFSVLEFESTIHVESACNETGVKEKMHGDSRFQF